MRAKLPAIVLTSALTIGGVAAGVAYAAIGGAQAPYARAAAVVDANGSVVRSKGVTAVRKINTGQYCIEVDPDIDATKAVPVATKRWGAPWNSTVFVDQQATQCGDSARHIFVGAGNNGAAADIPFNVIVP
ncbi:hypothetical protein AB0M95_14960 [Sphaerisporangium sp. NPDC051017]|uniref:hypothetical protein n=1 Tax=Sphaerisporangium sp. NPDC051017 TaxID=3154636 RepID=UPI0034389A7E